MKFSEKIVYMRKKRNISQDRLAKKMGVSRQTIYKWEADLNTPEFNKIERLAEILNISYDLLLDDNIDLDKYFNESTEESKTTEDVTEQPNSTKNKKPFILIGIAIAVAIVVASIIIGIALNNDTPVNTDTDSDLITDTDTSTDTDSDVIADNHNWDDWQEADKGSCSVPQTLERVCLDCGEKEIKEGKIIFEHDHSDFWFTKSPATCCEAEIEYTTCFNCHSEIYREGALALGHTYENGKCVRCDKAQYTEGVVYEISGNSAYVSGYNGTEESVSISPYYTPQGDNIKYPVTKVNAFSSEAIKELVIPEGVVEIGRGQFDCPSLSVVRFPATLKKIYDGAFDLCRNINRVYISDIKAWCEVSPVMNMMGGAGVFNYPYNMYLNDELLTDLHLTSDIYYINHYAFANCSSIKRLTMEPDNDSIRHIGIKAFYNSGLEYAQIDCTALDSSAFAFCYNLITVKITVRASVPNDNVFNNCYHLAEVYTTNKVTLGSKTDLGGVAEYAKIIHTDFNEPSIITKTKDGFVFATADGINYLIQYTGKESDVKLPREFEGEDYITAENFAMGGSPNTRIYSIFVPKEILYIEENAIIYSPYISVYFEVEEPLDSWEQEFGESEYIHFSQQLDY